LIYIAAVVSSIVTGGLIAFIARLAGIEHHGILAAVAVMGTGVQLILLIVWFQFQAEAQARAGDESGMAVGVEDANL
jgi:hypothetical protein